MPMHPCAGVGAGWEVVIDIRERVAGAAAYAPACDAGQAGWLPDSTNVCHLELVGIYGTMSSFALSPAGRIRHCPAYYAARAGANTQAAGNVVHRAACLRVTPSKPIVSLWCGKSCSEVGVGIRGRGGKQVSVSISMPVCMYNAIDGSIISS